MENLDPNQIFDNLTPAQQREAKKIQSQITNMMEQMSFDRQEKIKKKFVSAIEGGDVVDGFSDYSNVLQYIREEFQDHKKEIKNEKRQLSKEQHKMLNEALSVGPTCNCDFFPKLPIYRDVKCSVCRESVK